MRESFLPGQVYSQVNYLPQQLLSPSLHSGNGISAQTPISPMHSGGMVWEVSLHIHDILQVITISFCHKTCQGHATAVKQLRGSPTHSLFPCSRPMLRAWRDSLHTLLWSGGFALHLSLQVHKVGKINVMFLGQLLTHWRRHMNLAAG